VSQPGLPSQAKISSSSTAFGRVLLDTGRLTRSVASVMTARDAEGFYLARGGHQRD